MFIVCRIFSRSFSLLRAPGHAGAIISGGKGGAGDKIKAMEAAGIRMTASPAKIGSTMLQLMKEHKLA